MRKLFSLALLPALSFGGVAMLGGCQTTQPGVTYTLGDYTGTVNSSPDRVTTAAVKAARDLDLTSITSVSTRVDGKVMAQTAHSNDVTVNIVQAGDNVSKVTIRVGGGDEAISAQLFDRIKTHLGWI